MKPMKTSVIISLLITLALAGEAAETWSDVKRRATELSPPKGKKPVTEAALRAAATTNFNARCAIDPRWKMANSQLATAESALAKTRERLSAEHERVVLQYKAKQITTTRTQQIVDLTAAERRGSSAVAAAKLQKLEAESHLRKLYPNLR
jgi:hypothetical protein